MKGSRRAAPAPSRRAKASKVLLKPPSDDERFEAANASLRAEEEARAARGEGPLKNRLRYRNSIAERFRGEEHWLECYALLAGEEMDDPEHPLPAAPPPPRPGGPKTVVDWSYREIPIEMEDGTIRKVQPEELADLTHFYEGPLGSVAPRPIRGPLGYLRSRHPEAAEILDAIALDSPGLVRSLEDEADRACDRHYAAALKRNGGFPDEVQRLVAAEGEPDWDAFKVVCHGEPHKAARAILKICARATPERRPTLARELARSIFPDLCERHRSLRENSLYRLDWLRFFADAVLAYLRNRGAR